MPEDPRLGALLRGLIPTIDGDNDVHFTLGGNPGWWRAKMAGALEQMDHATQRKCTVCGWDGGGELCLVCQDCRGATI